MRRAGVAREGKVLGADAQLIRAQDMLELVRSVVRDDPLGLLCDPGACTGGQPLVPRGSPLAPCEQRRAHLAALCAR